MVSRTPVMVYGASRISTGMTHGQCAGWQRRHRTDQRGRFVINGRQNSDGRDRHGEVDPLRLALASAFGASGSIIKSCMRLLAQRKTIQGIQHETLPIVFIHPVFMQLNLQALFQQKPTGMGHRPHQGLDRDGLETGIPLRQGGGKKTLRSGEVEIAIGPD
jgi:hypothetical protein